MSAAGDVLQPLTMGVEWEFVLPLRIQRQGEGIDVLRRDNLGVIIIPYDYHGDLLNYCLRSIVKELRRKGFDMNDVDEFNTAAFPEGPTLPSPHANNSVDMLFHRWGLEEETVSLPVHIQQTLRRERYILTRGAELVTPAFSATPVNFMEIERMVSSVLSFLKPFNDDSCGLHVHVGSGRSGLPDDAVRKIACLLWAVDPILYRLHTEQRHDVNFAQRNRYRSNLARGMTAAVANTAIDVTLDFVNFDRATDPCGIIEGVRELIKCKNSGAVARLMSTGSRNAAYNFGYYLMYYNVKPTIEFRQAGGTLNGKWMRLWAQICVRICEYAAREMADDDLYEIAGKCEEVEAWDQSGLEENQRKIDVYTSTFLSDIGLAEAAQYILTTTPTQRTHGNDLV
ncbi:hypothetical protein JX265_005331 [Neoarthrinium moseri]|uniref:Amidoligase enzyme n=1 Tax=Neoarthrinium moseri TaxID=1658444 RepID=A0A9Q0AQ13_9PEZI|nr:hypothetical protein JX265_005331 [Neoarthrinium moseri]